MSVLVLICRYVSCQRGDRPFVLPSRVFEPTTNLMDIGDFGGVLAPNELLPSPFFLLELEHIVPDEPLLVIEHERMKDQPTEQLVRQDFFRLRHTCFERPGTTSNIVEGIVS